MGERYKLIMQRIIKLEKVRIIPVREASHIPTNIIDYSPDLKPAQAKIKTPDPAPLPKQKPQSVSEMVRKFVDSNYFLCDARGKIFPIKIKGAELQPLAKVDQVDPPAEAYLFCECGECFDHTEKINDRVISHALDHLSLPQGILSQIHKEFLRR